MLQTNATRPAPLADTAKSPAGAILREKILGCLANTTELPTPPAIALEVINRASAPDCESSDLADLIARDAVLCAWVLRAVNSVVFGFRNRVTSVPDAVRRMGIRPLRSLVLAFALSNLRWSPLPREVLQAHWRVSLAGALAARQLAIRARKSAPDTDLAAGLVRDVGVLVMHQLFPTEYRSVLETSPEILSAFQCDLEKDVFSIDHAEVSAELLRLWCLPEDLTTPIRCHHDWDQAVRLSGEIGDRARLLWLASQFAQLYLTPNRPMLFRQIRQRARDLSGMSDVDLKLFLESIHQQMTEFASVLHVDVGAPGDVSRLVGRGIEELARMAVASEVSPFTGQPAVSPTQQAAQCQQEESVSVTSGFGGGSPVAELLSRLFPNARDKESLGEFDGYQVTQLLGHGAMGAVFRAMDPRLARMVAIKVLLPHRSDGLARSRFLQEGRAIAAVAHENVVQVFAVGEGRGVPYIVMEYVEGTSLAEWMLKAPLPLADVLQIGLDTASGLAAAHARGLVHRDVKPANLLWDRVARRVKITDFGLAQVGGTDHLSAAGSLVGTPSYMSPEQANSQTVDARSDMFSLGTVLYLACTGRLPFEAPTVAAVLRAIRDRTPLPVREHNPELPAWLDEILSGLLSKDPARRFPMAAELKRLFLLKRAGCLVETSRERRSGLVRRLPL